jgi:hypothetical protein
MIEGIHGRPLVKEKVTRGDVREKRFKVKV